MGDKKVRLTVSIPQEIKCEIDLAKKNEFYDKPYSELYRQIIRLGLEKMNEDKAEKSSRINNMHTTENK